MDTVTIVFKYIDVDDGSRSPRIPVLVNGRFRVFGLLDSGADVSVMTDELAHRLNIQMQPGSPAVGIGGAFESSHALVHITLTQGKESRPLHLPVKIMHLDPAIPFLLGRKVFFSEFIITFNESEETIALEKV
jgi:hypothetical protein